MKPAIRSCLMLLSTIRSCLMLLSTITFMMKAAVCPSRRQRDEVREDPDTTIDFRLDQSDSGEGERQFPSNCDEYQSDTSAPGTLLCQTRE